MKHERCFIVMFQNLHVWSAGSFFNLNWQWPPDYIQPISSALKRKIDVVDLRKNTFNSLQLVTLHFDGTMEKRATKNKSSFKGNLYVANTGDVVYSKIDVRNGAIGIVPHDMEQIAVSSEFPVYEVKSEIAIPQYIKLLFRTQYFRQAINSMISGTSGRKRVQPSHIETINVPLPPLHLQQAIVNKWQNAHDEIKVTEKRIKQLSSYIDNQFLKDLGIAQPLQQNDSKVFVVLWNQLSRWDVTFAQNLGRSLRSTKYQTVSISDVIEPLKHTTIRMNPNEAPKEKINYIGLANVEAATGKLVDFMPVLGETINSSCVVFDSEHILYAKLRPYLRKVIVPSEYGLLNGVASSEFLAIKASGNILHDFLSHYLRSSAVAAQAKQAIGARMPRISSESLLNFNVPLPPFEIQQKILDKINQINLEIAREREVAERKAREIDDEIEALILGAKKLDGHN